MAVASLSTYSLPDFAFRRPDSTRRLRVSLSRISLSRGKKSALSFRARVQREEFVVEERERESVSEASSVELNGNGNGSVYGHNGAVERYTNGSVGVIESENGAINGSLVKYVNGNGLCIENR
ncbi:ABC2 homolog 13 [Actinidia rufa]|uniref:ABC2 homolog 13 n=1 Tax=Actinidia rufa TaxID=165716 RepID=A0A7J0F8A8_9ERIC|nr:ABC2 homolog 13 [Actinidia rufa]